METSGYIWIPCFIVSIALLNVLSTLLRGYICKQPSGNNSLFVYMVEDICVVMQLHGTVHCVVVIVSRFETVVQFFRTHDSVAINVCLLVELVNTTTILYLGNSCIVRILCFSNISFMEEVIGEKVTRISLACITISTAVLNCIFMATTGDITNGTMFNMMTRQISKAGKYVNN